MATKGRREKYYEGDFSTFDPSKYSSTRTLYPDLAQYEGDNGSQDERKTDEQLIKSRNSQSRLYLANLKSITRAFSKLFSVAAIFYALSFLVSVVISVSAATSGDLVFGLVSLLVMSVNFAFIALFTYNCAAFASLQITKIEDDIEYYRAYEKVTLNMTTEIREDVKKRATEIAETITVNAPVGNISIIRGDHASVTQTASLDAPRIVANELGLLRAIAEDAGNGPAIELARTIENEAKSSEPDKSLILDAWTKLVALLPVVGSMVSIANAIKALLGL
ncbi:UNVERIFIED_ORG: hypothetical protein BTE55_10335 [Rhizobium sophorae]